MTTHLMPSYTPTFFLVRKAGIGPPREEGRGLTTEFSGHWPALLQSCSSLILYGFSLGGVVPLMNHDFMHLLLSVLLRLLPRLLLLLPRPQRAGGIAHR